VNEDDILETIRINNIQENEEFLNYEKEKIRENL